MRCGILSVVVSLSVALGTGCHPKTIPVSDSPELPEQLSSPIKLTDTEVDAIVLAGLVKTPCFGSCPAFEALVYSSGKVTWRGDRNVEMIGNYEARVSEQWVAELMASAEQYGVFGLAPHYPSDGHNLDDVPHTLLVLRKGKETVRIDNQADAPLDLQHFEKFFVEKLIGCQWIAVGN